MKNEKPAPFSDSDEFVSGIFRGVGADGASLRDKEFEDCGFHGCNFSGATFAACKFVDCTFTDCNLSNIRMAGTRFVNVEFGDSKILGVDWTRATWPRIAVGAPLRFRKCLLDDSSFIGLTLEDIAIEDCRAHRVDFRDANLSRGNFARTDFSDASFGKTKLVEADFTGASNYTIDVFNNDIERARFSRDEALSLLGSLGIELVD